MNILSCLYHRANIAKPGKFGEDLHLRASRQDQLSDGISRKIRQSYSLMSIKYLLDPQIERQLGSASPINSIYTGLLRETRSHRTLVGPKAPVGNSEW